VSTREKKQTIGPEVCLYVCVLAYVCLNMCCVYFFVCLCVFVCVVARQFACGCKSWCNYLCFFAFRLSWQREVQ